MILLTCFEREGDMNRSAVQVALFGMAVLVSAGCVEDRPLERAGNDGEADRSVLPDAADGGSGPVDVDSTDVADMVDLHTQDVETWEPPGPSCGDGLCSADEHCGNCEDCACPEDQVCHADFCCSPECDGKKCGFDGCGGSCGQCPGDDPCHDQCQDGQCVPTAASEEVCNGKDDDCDGEVDEPVEKEGEYLNLCDDQNDCTDDTCKAELGCVNKPLNQGECVDGDACTLADHCDEGKCVGSQIVCNDGNPCTDDSCDGLGGCESDNNSDDCDDLDPCTVADQCSDGECDGFPVDCDCLADEDCNQLEDDDLCNGTLVCDQEQFPYKCVINPETIVTCPEPDGASAFCIQSHCDPASGECSFVPDHEGFPCEDGDICTASDHCHLGQCEAGDAFSCDDGNPCTDDSCQADAGCIHQSNNHPCDDANSCTTGDVCADGMCHGSGSVDCDDDNVCTKDTCTPDSGCNHELIAAACSDGDPCTVNDQCSGGVCVSGPTLDCNDGNACTDDACNDDGLCQHVPNDGACDDGNACTAGDKCSGGWCLGNSPVECDDDNICTDDSCAPAAGCLFALNSAPGDDGDICTTSDYCHLGGCEPGDEFNCGDGNSCTDDSCHWESGCIHQPKNEPCDDGNACTLNDWCGSGWCNGNAMLNCDDDDPCTTDTCEPDQGCVHNSSC